MNVLDKTKRISPTVDDIVQALKTEPKQRSLSTTEVAESVLRMAGIQPRGQQAYESWDSVLNEHIVMSRLRSQLQLAVEQGLVAEVMRYRRGRNTKHYLDAERHAAAKAKLEAEERAALEREKAKIDRIQQGRKDRELLERIVETGARELDNEAFAALARLVKA